jgi:hypothetical protein
VVEEIGTGGGLEVDTCNGGADEIKRDDGASTRGNECESRPLVVE